MTKTNVIKNMTSALKVFAWEFGHYDAVYVDKENAREPWIDCLNDVYEVKRPHTAIYVQYCEIEDRIYLYRPINRKYDDICVGYQCSLSVHIGTKTTAEWIAELLLAVTVMEKEQRWKGV